MDALAVKPAWKAVASMKTSRGSFSMALIEMTPGNKVRLLVTQNPNSWLG